jgi:hypothetical protein
MEGSDLKGVEVVKLEECGRFTAMFGLSLNKEQPIENMWEVAKKLAFADAGSHRKFLRQMYLSFKLRIPRYVWAEVDTYKVGPTRNSGSTMHNVHKRPFTGDDFTEIDPIMLTRLNQIWLEFKSGERTLHSLKANIPEGLLQTASFSMNYEVLRAMYLDRKKHRLPEWPYMLDQMIAQVDYPELIIKKEK